MLKFCTCSLFAKVGIVRLPCVPLQSGCNVDLCTSAPHLKFGVCLTSWGVLAKIKWSFLSFMCSYSMLNKPFYKLNTPAKCAG